MTSLSFRSTHPNDAAYLDKLAGSQHRAEPERSSGKPLWVLLPGC